MNRGSLAGDVAPTHRNKNVFDMGEVGMSLSANSLTLGCDCRGEIFYFDRTLNIMDDQPLAEPAKGLAPPSPGEISA